MTGAVHPIVDDSGALLDSTVNLTVVSLLANTDVPRLLAPVADYLRSVPGMHFSICPIQTYSNAPSKTILESLSLSSLWLGNCLRLANRFVPP